MDAIFDPALALHLPLHRRDGASFESEDKNSYLCTVTGAVWTPQGRSFDGVDDTIVCGAAADMQFTTGLSVEAWFRTAVDEGLPVGRMNSLTDGWGLWQGVNTAHKMRGHVTLTDGTAVVETVTSTDDDRWHHIVMTYNGQKLVIYCDGQAENSLDKTTALVAPQTRIVRLGRRTDQATNFWNGLIGEVRIYSRALTALEAQRNYLATKWRYR